MPNNSPKPGLEVAEKTSLALKVTLTIGMVSAFLVGAVMVTTLFPQPSEVQKIPLSTIEAEEFGAKLVKDDFSQDSILIKFKPETIKAVDKEQKIKKIADEALQDPIPILLDEIDKSQIQVEQLKTVKAESKEITQLFTDQVSPQKIKDKFKQRSLRISQDVKEVPDLSGWYVLKLKDKIDKGAMKSLIARLKIKTEIEVAEPNYIMHANLIPNDPYYSSSGTWGQSYDDLWGLKKISTEAAWDISQGQGITVAVIDTGLDYTHEDIQSNVWINANEIPGNGIDDDGNNFVDDYYGFDFANNDPDPLDGLGHGTHVSGTIAAVGNNTKGIIGVAPQAKIMAVKGLDDDGSGSSINLAEGIVYAADMGADILNNSWGYSVPAPLSQAISDAVDYAYALGCVIVASAGNSNDDVGTPENGYGICTLDKVITVASSDHNDVISNFSNWGNKIDVAAPGGDSSGDSAPYMGRNILSLRSAGTDMYDDGYCIVNNSYYRSRGTSMSAPHVSGLAALLLSRYPKLSGQSVKYIIRESSDDLGDPGFDPYFGYGRINAHQTLLTEGVYMNNLLMNDILGGDGDGHPDPNEDIRLIITLIAAGRNMADVSATILSDSPYVTISDGSSNYGLIQSGEEVGNSANPFLIRIADNVPSGQISFTLNITAEGGSYHKSYPFAVRVLLPQDLIILSGNNQSGFQGSQSSGPLVVKLVDQEGYPISNQRITFEILEGGGSLSDTEVFTDFFGKAQTYLTLGNLPGGVKFLKHKIKATAEGLENHPVEFTAYATDFDVQYKKVWSLKEAYPNFFPMYDYYIYSVETGDLDKDGHKEFYIGTFIHSSPIVKAMYIFEESGDDSYSLIWSYDGFSNPPVSFAYGDIDRDGEAELVVGTSEGRIYIVEATGDNNFSIQEIMNLYVPAGFNSLSEVKITDLDKDNIPELVIRGTYLYIFEHAGNVGEYTFVKIYEVRNSYPFTTIGDSDNDGLEEIITNAYRNPVRLIRHEYNPQTNGFEAKSNQVTTNIDVWPKRLLVDDLDGDSLNEVFTYGQIYLDTFSWDKILFDIESISDDSFVATGWQFDVDDNYFIHTKNELEKAALRGLDNPVIFVGKSTYNEGEKAYLDSFSYFDDQYIPINSVMFDDETIVDLVIEDFNNDNLANLIVVSGSYGGVGGKNVVIFDLMCEGACSDGTLPSQCSVNKPKYCNNCALIDNCQKCGCPTDKPYCNPTTLLCEAKCSDGTPFVKCNAITKKYCNNGTLENCPSATPYCNPTTLLCEAKCLDGTPFGQCSGRKPLYCNNQGKLTSGCLLCGCPAGQQCKKTTGFPAGQCIGGIEPTPAL